MGMLAQSLFLATSAAMALATPAAAQNLKQVGTIAIPGEPSKGIGGLAINQTSGLGYLADRDSKSVIVFDTKTDAFVTRIPGFVGATKNGDASGPNAVAIVNDGAELWVSDGDSTIKVVDLKAGKITSTFSTGGKLRANGMAFNPKDKIVIVANSNDEPAPFLSLVSSEPDHKIVAKIPMPDSAENLERSAYHAPSGMFYTVIPVLKSEKPIGGMAQIDAKSGKLIKLHALEGCHPHSLQIVSDTTIFLGCSSAHGAASKPGGDLGIFDIAAGKIEAMLQGAGGNGSSDSNPKLGQVYHAASHGALRVIDVKSKKLVQDIPTSVGARSVGVTQGNNRVYLATNASGPCGACIMVFAPQ